jgi:hypothetical protein
VRVRDPVIGLLSSRSPTVDTPLIAIIRQGLKDEPNRSFWK